MALKAGKGKVISVEKGFIKLALPMLLYSFFDASSHDLVFLLLFQLIRIAFLSFILEGYFSF